MLSTRFLLVGTSLRPVRWVTTHYGVFHALSSVFEIFAVHPPIRLGMRHRTKAQMKTSFGRAHGRSWLDIAAQMGSRDGV